MDGNCLEHSVSRPLSVPRGPRSAFPAEAAAVAAAIGVSASGAASLAAARDRAGDSASTASPASGASDKEGRVRGSLPKVSSASRAGTGVSAGTGKHSPPRLSKSAKSVRSVYDREQSRRTLLPTRSLCADAEESVAQVLLDCGRHGETDPLELGAELETALFALGGRNGGDVDLETFCSTMALPRQVASAWFAWFSDGADTLAAVLLRSKVQMLLNAEESDEVKAKVLFEVLDTGRADRLLPARVAGVLAAALAGLDGGERDVGSLEPVVLGFLEALDANQDGHVDLQEWLSIQRIFPELFDAIPFPLQAFVTPQGGLDSSIPKPSKSKSKGAGQTPPVAARAQRRRWRLRTVDTVWWSILISVWLALAARASWMVSRQVEEGTARPPPSTPSHVDRPTSDEGAFGGSGPDETFGYWYVLARACGAALNPMCAALLLPICGEVLAFLRNMGLHQVLPLDSAVSFHKVIARWILVFGLLHTIAHVMNYLTSWRQYSLWEHLLSIDGFNPNWTGLAGITGAALATMLSVISVFASRRLRRGGWHNAFWCTHFLWLPWYICLCLHAPNCWKWVVAPLSLWAVSRLARVVMLYSGRGHTVISSLEQLPADCVRVKIVRPSGFNFRPGMWCRIQVPRLSSFEWHPFTISSAPEVEEHFTLHVRALGDWTRSLQELAGRLLPDEEVPVYVQGPFGAPAEHAWHTEHPVLIAAGIGVTPFASILQSLAVQRSKGRLAKRIGTALMDVAVPPGASKLARQSIEDTVVGLLGKPRRASKVKHVDFIWVNREQGAFSWLSRLLLQILEDDRALAEGIPEQFIDFGFYLTGLRDDPSAMLKMMVSLAGDALRDGCREPITGIASRVTPSRPDWHRIFTRIREKRKGSVRVMYCGPKALGDSIRVCCEEFGFSFHKENF